MVDKYIKEVLSEHGKVNVPNFGLIFKSSYTPNNIQDSNTISQPSYTLEINQEYANEEDTWLLYAAARGERIGLEDAASLIGQRVNEMKSDLGNGREVYIDGVGRLTSEGGKLKFTDSLYSSTHEEADDNFGMPSQINVNTEEKEEPVPVLSATEENIEDNYQAPHDVTRPEIIKEEPDAEPESQYYEEEPEGNSKYFLIGAGIVLLLLLGWVGFYYFEKSESELDDLATTEEVQNSQPSDAGNIAASDEAINNDNNDTENTAGTDNVTDSEANSPLTSEIPLSVKEKGKRYYIIGGAFTINENAQKLKRVLKTQGLKAKVLEPKGDNPLYRVSLADYEEFNDALAKTEALKTTHDNSIWILKY